MVLTAERKKGNRRLMALLARLFDFTAGQPILSGDVDSEFNQLVNILAGVSTNKNALVKFSDSADAPVALDQLGAGPVQVWRQAGAEKARMKGNGQLVGVPKSIHTNSASVGNVGAGLDDLHTFSLPAGSLNANGDFIDVTYSGNFSTNDNDKRIVISFASQIADDSGLFDQDSGNWVYTVRYLRVTSTTVRFSLHYAWGLITANGASVVAGNGRSGGGNGLLNVADLSNNAVTVKAQAEGTANNDIVQTLSILQLTQNT